MALSQKTIIITGGTSGIGKALAFQFAEKGFSVVVSGRDQLKLNTTVSQLLKINNRVLGVCSDVSKVEDCQRLIESTVDAFGSIDILVNNAGISMRAILADMELSVIKNVVDTNFWGSVYCTKFALPFLLKSQGSVVGISSIAGKRGLPGRTGYSASKFAMEGFLEALRTENINTGLHVLVVCPGFTESAIREMALGPDGKPQKESPRDEKNMMTAEEVARHVYKSVLLRKRDLVLTRQGKLTILLNKFFPGFTDKLVFKHMSSEPGSPF